MLYYLGIFYTKQSWIMYIILKICYSHKSFSKKKKIEIVNSAMNLLKLNGVFFSIILKLSYTFKLFSIK